MSELTITSLDQLDPAVVEELHAEWNQLVSEKFPELQLKRGTIHDLMGFLAGAVSGAIQQAEIDRVRRVRSLDAIRQDPELASEEDVDHVLSNYGATRRAGTAATGIMTIVVDDDTSVVLSADVAYTANGIDFKIDRPIIAKPPGSTILQPLDERVLTLRTDGRYEFRVPVTAQTVGENGNIRRGTALVPDTEPARFVAANAASDFSGGQSTETNTDLVAHLDESMAAKIPSNGDNIAALIRLQESLKDIRHISSVGFLDPEMTRDQHAIWPGSQGGRVDVYIRSVDTPVAVELTKTCTNMGTSGGFTTWQCTITRDDVPGFYEIAHIRRVGETAEVASKELIADQRGMDLSEFTWVPDVVTSVEAAYSRYQTSVIQFKDAAITGADEEAEYVITVLHMPQIAAVQDFMSLTGTRNLAGDVLVRAAVPCNLSINFVMYAKGIAAPDLEEIRIAIANLVNNKDFPGKLYASEIIDVVHDFLDTGLTIGTVQLHGAILRMDGDTTYIRDTEVLVIPELPSVGVTPRTTTFFLYPDDVGIQVRTE